MSTLDSSVDVLRQLPEENERVKADHLDCLPPSESQIEPPLRVMALHALLYCERLFYLEEVEEIRVADAAVYAGRRLHVEVAAPDDETPEQRSLDVSSDRWGLFGKVDAVRRRDGVWVAIEHKRGRCRRDEDGHPQAWPSDRIQAVAYAVLLEEGLAEPIPQARIRYHADGVTAFVEIDDAARRDLETAVQRARELRRNVQRPPVAENENLCPRCSLAPVCLPEEERLAEEEDAAEHEPPRLFPSRREEQTLHIVSPRAHLGRSGAALLLTNEDEKQKIPVEQLDSVVIHGYGQVSTQAIHLCAQHGVAVQWFTMGGKFAAGTACSPGRVQQRLRQYTGLADPAMRLDLARRLVAAKIDTQRRYVLRASRAQVAYRAWCRPRLVQMLAVLGDVPKAESAASLLGLEGIAARAYFECLRVLVDAAVPEELRPDGRNRRPPRDRFNCLLSFGYALLQSLIHRTILAVGLEPALGFYHQPRTAAPPLVLDLMEPFRTLLWDIPLIGSLNRGQWNVTDDFSVTPGQVWLSDPGRRKAIELFEQRLTESYRHPHTGQSLSYARIVELETRLLEKEWTGCPGLFARMRLR
ncbi:MAG: type I-MYXAN CRISPR-associated endonuclease Cas1 [Thermoguttaceae bacterium]